MWRGSEEDFMDIKSRIRSFSLDRDFARNIDRLNELVTEINRMPDDKHKNKYYNRVSDILLKVTKRGIKNGDYDVNSIKKLDKLIVINTLIRGGINKMDDYNYSDMYEGLMYLVSHKRGLFGPKRCKVKGINSK